jgi:hypothetical protein
MWSDAFCLIGLSAAVAILLAARTASALAAAPVQSERQAVTTAPELAPAAYPCPPDYYRRPMSYAYGLSRRVMRPYSAHQRA